MARSFAIFWRKQFGSVEALFVGLFVFAFPRIPSQRKSNVDWGGVAVDPLVKVYLSRLVRDRYNGYADDIAVAGKLCRLGSLPLSSSLRVLTDLFTVSQEGNHTSGRDSLVPSC